MITMKEWLTKVVVAFAVLVALPWLIAFGMAVGGFIADVLSGAGKPIVQVPVPIEYVWIATQWLVALGELLIMASAFSAFALVGHHTVQIDSRENGLLP